METSSQSRLDRWQIGSTVSPIPYGFSRFHQAYLARRAALLMQATRVLGSPEAAVHWFNSPARGLDYRSPCSVLSDADGYRLITDYLIRIEYCVY